MKMPVKTSVKVVSLIKELNAFLKEAENFRTELVEKYGKKDKEGNITVPNSKKEQFIQDLNEKMFSKEVEIKSELISYEDFDENFKITPGELGLISYLIKN